MKIIIIILILLVGGSLTEAREYSRYSKDTTQEVEHKQHHSIVEQQSPVFQRGSGTGWIPASSSMYGFMQHTNNWMLMYHGNVFIRYNSQDVTDKGVRGDSQFDAPNWFMLMAENNVSRNILRFSFMMSLDPVLVGGSGYPLLFQSGETWNDEPLVDRQHPHDFISELSMEYTRLLGNDYDLSFYLGYSGEPALGPVAFMHRPSALNNPDSPLGHHWQDATHITYGVGTIGFRVYNFKLEGSLFTGREPDEERWGFDKPRFDSYSGRISMNPGRNFSLQTSYAIIKSPEIISPEESVHRTTASVLNSQLIGQASLNSAVIWGYNYIDTEHKEHSLTFETDLRINRTSVYGRYEWIEKSSEELDLEALGHDLLFNINAVTLGANYSLLQLSGLRLMLGIQGSIFSSDEILHKLYGKNPMSAQIYLKISPPVVKMY